MTRRRVARRTIPVAVAAPVQLPLSLRWDQPLDHVRATPEPEPAAPVALRKASAA